MEKIRVDEDAAAVELNQLRERHGEIERRLSELERHLSWTPDEQMERARLKKEKLRNKDRIALLAAAIGPGSSSVVTATGAPPGTRLPAA